MPPIKAENERTKLQVHLGERQEYQKQKPPGKIQGNGP